MPIFEFQCEKCGFKAEVFYYNSFYNKDDELKCAECGGMMERMMSAIGNYQIKGDNSASTRPKKK